MTLCVLLQKECCHASSSGTVPYSEIRKQDDIRYKVLSGERPEIPHCVFTGAVEQKYFEHYTALITRGWQHEPALRPSASEVLSELECIWMGCCASVIVDAEVQPEMSEIYDAHSAQRQSRFSVWSSLTPSTANAGHSSSGSQSATEQSVKRICELMQADKESFEALDDHSGAIPAELR